MGESWRSALWQSENGATSLGEAPGRPRFTRGHQQKVTLKGCRKKSHKVSVLTCAVEILAGKGSAGQELRLLRCDVRHEGGTCRALVPRRRRRRTIRSLSRRRDL